MEVSWKKLGLAAAGLGGFGYLAYKYYNAKEEKEDYAFKRAQRAKRRAKEETKQELLQERLIEEIEAPFVRYCAEMGEFGFGKGFLDLQAKLTSEQEKVDSISYARSQNAIPTQRATKVSLEPPKLLCQAWQAYL